MFKRLILLFLISLLQFSYLYCEAKTVKVTALNEFSSINPPQNFNVILDEPLQTSQTSIIPEKSILSGYIYKVIPPKRLKQDANFVFIPTKYITPQKQSIAINNIVATHTTKINKTELVVSSALVFTVGLIPALIATTGFFAAEGALKDKTGNKVEASVNSAYEKSYLSFGKKGNELLIKKNQDFLLNIAIIKEQAPNYTYTNTK